MSSNIDLLIDVLRRVSSDSQLRSSISSALKRSVTAARMAGNKTANKRYNLKSSKIKSAMSTKVQGMQGIIIARGGPLKLIEFKPKVSKRKGVRVAIRRGEQKTLPHSFFVSTRGNTFHRTSAHRLPIHSEYTVSVPQMIDDEPIIEAMEDRAKEMFGKRLEAEINRRLGGY